MRQPIDDGAAPITALLPGLGGGDDDELVRLLYEELRRTAEAHMRREGTGETLQATALVHEVWARLATSDHLPQWPSRGHFFAWASTTMRNLLRSHARRRQSLRGGGGRLRVALSDGELDLGARRGPVEFLEIDDALEALGEQSTELLRIVELRMFGGLSYRDIAQSLSLSEDQVDRRLRIARAWLEEQLSE